MTTTNIKTNLKAFGKQRRKSSYTAKKISGLHVLPFSLTTVLIFLFVFAYLSICASNVKTQYELSKLQNDKANLEKSRLALRLEVNRLNSLDRIEKIAKKELGMSHPPNRLVIDMRNHSVLQASIGDIAARGIDLEGTPE